MKVKHLCFIFSLLLSSVSATAQTEFEIANHYGIGVGVGTEGISIEAGTCLTKYVQARFGVNIFPNIKGKVDENFEIGTDFANSILPDASTLSGVNAPTLYGDISLEAGVGRTTCSLLFDIYPFPDASSFFVTAGAMFGGNKIVKVKGHSNTVERLLTDGTFTYKDVVYHPTPEAINEGIVYPLEKYNIRIPKDGSAEADIRVSGFRPYLGLGFGRMVPKSRVGFRFELGAIFQGSPEVYCNDKKLNEEAVSADNSDAADVIKYMKKFTVYPRLKLTLTGRIF